MSRRRRLAPLGIVGAVVAASLLPGSAGASALPPGSDLLLHAFGYAAVAAALAWSERVTGLRTGATLVVAVAAVGAGVELLQSPVPGRTPSVADAVANALGASVGWWLARVDRDGTPSTTGDSKSGK